LSQAAPAEAAGAAAEVQADTDLLLQQKLLEVIQLLLVVVAHAAQTHTQADQMEARQHLTI
jgi:hypothetical protein